MIFPLLKLAHSKSKYFAPVEVGAVGEGVEVYVSRRPDGVVHRWKIQKAKTKTKRSAKTGEQTDEIMTERTNERTNAQRAAQASVA